LGRLELISSFQPTSSVPKSRRCKQLSRMPPAHRDAPEASLTTPTSTLVLGKKANEVRFFLPPGEGIDLKRYNIASKRKAIGALPSTRYRFNSHVSMPSFQALKTMFSDWRLKRISSDTAHDQARHFQVTAGIAVAVFDAHEDHKLNLVCTGCRPRRTPRRSWD